MPKIARGLPFRNTTSYDLIRKMDKLCRKTDDLDQLGWSPRFYSVCVQLKEMGAEAVPAMLDGIKNRNLDWKTRFTLISMFPYQELGEYDTLVVKVLCEVLKDKTEDPIIRSKIPVYAFAKMKEKRAVPTLIKVMMDKNNPVKVRVEAAQFFVYKGCEDTSALDSLIKLLGTSEKDLRRVAAFGSERIGVKYPSERKKVIKVLRAKIREEKDSVIKPVLIVCLGYGLKDTSSVNLFIDMMKHGSIEAAKALYQIGTPDALISLYKLASDHSSKMSEWVIDIFEDNHDSRIIPYLEKAIERTEDKAKKKRLQEKLDMLKRVGKKGGIKK